jgi:VIT1/CCC1 family predicted Fe2+/Mn2+ transporter
VVWKTGRSALLGWSRLERLHRIVEQEKWEIEHHRDQERAELTELYRAKGFKDKLLEDVIEVFMSDGDRLLKVMIEEELGLSLESQEHPLKQAFGALIGGLFALVIFLFSIFFLSFPLVLTMSMCALAFCGFLTARSSNNEEVPTMIWHLGLGLLSFGVSYFLFIGL